MINELETIFYDYIKNNTTYDVFRSNQVIQEKNKIYPMILYRVLEIDYEAEGTTFVGIPGDTFVTDEYCYDGSFILDIEIVSNSEIKIDCHELLMKLNSDHNLQKYLENIEFININSISRRRTTIQDRLLPFEEQLVQRIGISTELIVGFKDINEIPNARVGKITGGIQ